MKNFERVFPYLLLVGYVSVAASQQLSLAHSLVVTALAGFAGFCSYVRTREQPDYEAQFQAIIDEQNKRIKDLEDFAGRQTFSQSNANNKVVW